MEGARGIIIAFLLRTGEPSRLAAGWLWTGSWKAWKVEEDALVYPESLAAVIVSKAFWPAVLSSMGGYVRPLR